jgi:hypothetical protein
MWAVAGNTIAQVKANQLPSALAANLDLCFVHCGKNSLDGVAANTAGYISDLTYIYDQLRANGTLVVAIPIRVCSGANAITGDNLLQMMAINRGIVEYARGKAGIIVVDVNPSFIDFSTGNAKSTYLRDGIHDNLISAKAMGQTVANAVSAVIPAWDDRFTHLGDTYDAVKNVRGNLIANGLVNGTAGTVQNGATGTGPDTWTFQRGANSGTLTLAGSSIAGTNTNQKKCRMTIGGTGDSNTAVLIHFDAIGSNFTVGDVVQGEVEIDWNFTTAGFVAIDLSVSFDNSGFSVIAESHDGYPTSANGLYDVSSGSMILRTEPLIVPANTAYDIFQLAVWAPSSGSVTGTVDIGRASLRKVV